MTAKRFIETLSTGIVTDNVTGKEYDCEMRIDEKLLELLNELYEENSMLRLQLNSCSDQRDEFHRGARENANRVGKSKKENERLKSELLNIEEDRDYYKSKASSLEEGYLQLQDREIRLKKENEQLKSKNNMLKTTIARNEAYITQLTHKGKWNTTSMIKTQFCKNCKHLELDGMFGLICEVSGNNKNHDCQKYEENDVI